MNLDFKVVTVHGWILDSIFTCINVSVWVNTKTNNHLLFFRFRFSRQMYFLDIHPKSDFMKRLTHCPLSQLAVLTCVLPPSFKSALSSCRVYNEAVERTVLRRWTRCTSPVCLCGFGWKCVWAFHMFCKRQKVKDSVCLRFFKQLCEDRGLDAGSG